MVNYSNNEIINEDCESSVIKYLQSEIPKYDLILISDFGHGFITNKIIKTIEKISKKLAVNTQTNAANMGFNMITKYKNPNYVCLDELEIRSAVRDKYSNIEDIVKKVSKILNTEMLVVTLGKKGSMGISKTGEINKTPIFSSKIVDTVGAGDAFFGYTAPCFAVNIPLDLISLIGNAVGAIAVQIMCNKNSVEKHELLEFIHTILQQR